MTYVRNGFAMSGEGEDRPAPGGQETDAVKRAKDSYFVPLRRLQDAGEFLGAMFARRTGSQAHFGQEAERAFVLFQGALHQTRTASSLLIEWTTDCEFVDPDTMQKFRQDIWQGMARYAGRDEIGADIEEGVEILERLCRPVLEWTT